MFPRYLFIHLGEQSDDWDPIRSTTGVSSLIRFGMEPARIPEDLIIAVKNRETKEGLNELQVGIFEEGQQVRIAEGSFESYEAIFKPKMGKKELF